MTPADREAVLSGSAFARKANPASGALLDCPGVIRMGYIVYWLNREQAD